MQHHSHDVYLIYAGGTFGSHGTPLSPLPADEFLPILTKQLATKLPNTHIQILPNTLIKDSSSLTPSDFVHLYGLILEAYAIGGRHFVLITGTDSLGFLAGFLAHALANIADISLVITGSMEPLFIPNNPTYTINDNSDAWVNLSDSILATATHIGVFVQFYHKLMDATDVQKINSQDHDAFIGKPANLKPLADVPTPKSTINQHLAKLPTLIERARDTQITAIYCLPNDTHNLEHQLSHLSDDTKAVILIGFGAGNVPSSPQLQEILDNLHTQHIPVVCTTMCAFGGTNTNYTAGSWQYQHGVVSSTLTIWGIYGQLLWQVLS